jgi:hypothetical protein
MKLTAKGTSSVAEIEEHSGGNPGVTVKVGPGAIALGHVSVFVTAPDADVAVSVNGQWWVPPSDDP